MAKRYPLDNVFAVQEEIAGEVLPALTQKMAEKGVKGTGKGVGGTTSFAAYDAYLRGRDQFDNASDQDSDQLALDSLDKALAIEPLLRPGPCRAIAIADRVRRPVGSGQGADRTLCPSDRCGPKGRLPGPELARRPGIAGLCLDGRATRHARRAPTLPAFLRAGARQRRCSGALCAVRNTLRPDRQRLHREHARGRTRSTQRADLSPAGRA